MRAGPDINDTPVGRSSRRTYRCRAALRLVQIEFRTRFGTAWCIPRRDVTGDASLIVQFEQETSHPDRIRRRQKRGGGHGSPGVSRRDAQVQITPTGVFTAAPGEEARRDARPAVPSFTFPLKPARRYHPRVARRPCKRSGCCPARAEPALGALGCWLLVSLLRRLYKPSRSAALPGARPLQRAMVAIAAATITTGGQSPSRRSGSRRPGSNPRVAHPRKRKRPNPPQVTVNRPGPSGFAANSRNGRPPRPATRRRTRIARKPAQADRASATHHAAAPARTYPQRRQPPRKGRVKLECSTPEHRATRPHPGPGGSRAIQLLQRHPPPQPRPHQRDHTTAKATPSS